MNKIVMKIWIVKLSIVFTVLACFMAPAAGMDAYAQTSGDFSVHAIIPDNQVDTRQTYFDLRMSPDQKQTIQIVIDNSRDEELVAQIRLNNASTGRNGLIVYTEQDVRDESLQVAVTDVAALQTETVTVPALGSKTVNIDIQMPKEELEGVILGGIVVTEDETGKNAQATEGISLNNIITYVIGLKLTENDSDVTPDFDLTAITPSLINYKTAVVATLHNKEARIVKNMEVKASVYRSGSDSVFRELSLEDAQMAPLSKGDFVIDWEGEALQPGTYRLKMSAIYEGKTWEWDEEFTIAAEASDLNKEAVGLKKDYRWLYVLAILAALAIVGFVAYWMGSRKRRSAWNRRG